MRQLVTQAVTTLAAPRFAKDTVHYGLVNYAGWLAYVASSDRERLFTAHVRLEPGEVFSSFMPNRPAIDEWEQYFDKNTAARIKSIAVMAALARGDSRTPVNGLPDWAPQASKALVASALIAFAQEDPQDLLYRGLQGDNSWHQYLSAADVRRIEAIAEARASRVYEWKWTGLGGLIPLKFR